MTQALALAVVVERTSPHDPPLGELVQLADGWDHGELLMVAHPPGHVWPMPAPSLDILPVFKPRPAALAQVFAP